VAKLKAADIRSQKSEELNKQLEDGSKKLLDLRFKLETKQLVNHSQIRQTKKDIARLKTVIREKELGSR
jgi:large subunit ribosomal protein L29